MTTTVTNEIELKIMLTPPHIPTIIAWLDQQNVLEKSITELGNTYFDTPEQFFAQQKMGLRVRNHNQHYEMTLKTKGDILGGLHIRPEYNLPLNSPKPDFKRLVSHYHLQFENVEQIDQSLQATFSTDFTRQSWLIDFNGSQIEAALDQGKVKNQYGEAEICELEFELKSGDLAAIFALLSQFPAQQGIYFSGLSKAQRGYFVGQAVKFEQEITHALQQKTGYELEQQLADYLRFGEQKQAVFTTFSQLTGKQFSDWQTAKNYAESAEYFGYNLTQLSR